MLGHALKMCCANFQGNRIRIDGEIAPDNSVLAYSYIPTVHTTLLRH